jgi:alpha-D-ribose 1-methylphosphonate 5-triphosphate synthase subunit PhnH
MANASLPRGLADPGADSQRVFRAVLHSMSRPGLCVPCPAECAVPLPMASAVGAVACCLLDHDTATWLDGAFDTAPIRAFLRFHTGLSFAECSSQAAFALIGDPARLPRFDRFAPGSARDPETSATLIIQLASLCDGEAVTIVGPGIEDIAAVRPLGLPHWFWDGWEDNHRQFPLGVDVILMDGSRLMSLPRTAHRA